jgi:hypothetical protein
MNVVGFGQIMRTKKIGRPKAKASRSLSPADATALSFVALFSQKKGNRLKFYQQVKKYLNPLGRQLARKHLLKGLPQQRFGEHPPVVGRYRPGKHKALLERSAKSSAVE